MPTLVGMATTAPSVGPAKLSAASLFNLAEGLHWTVSTNVAVPLPEDRRCSMRNATPEKSTNGAGALYRALVTHGLDDGFYGIFA
jgi:hypothetical protein